MNPRVIFEIIGFLQLLIGLFMLTGIPFSLYSCGDDIPALLISGFGTFLVGLLLRVTNKIDQHEELTKRNVYLYYISGLDLSFTFWPSFLHFRKSNM